MIFGVRVARVDRDDGVFPFDYVNFEVFVEYSDVKNQKPERNIDLKGVGQHRDRN